MKNTFHPTELKTIASFALPHEAEIARASLETIGISTILLNSESATALSHVGAGLEGVKLQVAIEDVERATAELQAAEGSSEIPAWHCTRCGSDVDAGFEVCWSCENAYSPEQTAKPTDAGKVLADAGDEESRRAWRAAVLGVVVPPLLLYALVLLIFMIRKPLSPVGTTRFYKTFFLAVIALTGWYFMFRSM